MIRGDMEIKKYCLIDGANGVYIPKVFKDRYLDHNGLKYISKFILDIKSDCKTLLEEWCEVLDNPDNENYWECWDEVVQLVTLNDTAGNKYYLEEDGDLFLIAAN